MSRATNEQTEAPPPKVVDGKTVWHVGTLRYTVGGLAFLFLWLLWGDFSFSIRDRSIGTVLNLQYISHHASNTYFTLVGGSLGAAIGLFLNPIIAFNSDRTRTRWGRRIPYMLLPTPFIVLAMLALAYVNEFGHLLDHFLGSKSPGFDTCVLAMFVVLLTIFDIATCVAGAVFNALLADVVPHILIGRFLGMFRGVSLLCGIVFAHYIMDNSQAYYKQIFIGLAIVYGVGFSLMCLMVKEGKYPPPEPLEGTGIEAIVDGTRTYFKEGFGNSFFLWFFAAAILGDLMMTPFNSFTLQFGFSMGMKTHDFALAQQYTYAFSLCMAFPLGWLADRFHPVRMTFVGVCIYSFLMFLSFAFVHDRHTFFLALLAHGWMAGTLYTVRASMPQRLLPRLKFGEISSAGGILGALCGIFISPSIGWFFDKTHVPYQWTFYMNFVFSLVNIGVFYILRKKIIGRGGFDHFVPPESETHEPA